MYKKSLALLFIALTFLCLTTNVIAQTASWKTKVGNPPETGVHPTPPYTPGDSNHQGCDYRCAIKKEFDINVIGYFTQDTLEWFWEKLWEVSQTNFIPLIKGTSIQSTGSDKGYSGIHGNGITLSNYRAEFLIKIVFIHEYGHWIQRYRDGKNFAREHAQLIAEREPGETPISKYATPGPNGLACSGVNWPGEDYADMIAYYLNPEFTDITVVLCAGKEVNPYLNGGHPKHKKIAEMILGPY